MNILKYPNIKGEILQQAIRCDTSLFAKNSSEDTKSIDKENKNKLKPGSIKGLREVKKPQSNNKL